MRPPVSGYCIYNNSNSTDLSIEHVIPLSLGGHDHFSIFADRKTNTGAAAKIDSAIATDFHVLFSRRDANAVGHSGRDPVPIAKSSTFNGHKVQVSFGKNGLEVFDVVTRKYVEKSELAGQKVQVGGINISLDAPYRFVAKIALSAGYFTYGDAFVEQVQHEEARAFLRSTDISSLQANVRVFDRFQAATDEKHLHMKLMTSQHPESKVLLMPGPDCFAVAVGILGNFMGFMNIPAPGQRLCNSGDYRWGHVITVRKDQVIRQSFQSAYHKLLKDIEENEPAVMAAKKMEESLRDRSDSQDDA